MCAGDDSDDDGDDGGPPMYVITLDLPYDEVAQLVQWIYLGIASAVPSNTYGVPVVASLDLAG